MSAGEYVVQRWFEGGTDTSPSGHSTNCDGRVARARVSFGVDVCLICVLWFHGPREVTPNSVLNMLSGKSSDEILSVGGSLEFGLGV